jgi:hypothetical protein
MTIRFGIPPLPPVRTHAGSRTADIEVHRMTLKFIGSIPPFADARILAELVF